nr:MAG TPA: hypothetical protein [Caudoviricetes sp.]
MLVIYIYRSFDYNEMFISLEYHHRYSRDL